MTGKYTFGKPVAMRFEVLVVQEPQRHASAPQLEVDPAEVEAIESCGLA